jgi:predicted MFS family arabinose efflux permease
MRNPGNEVVLKILSSAAFLIFFQSYLIAPLIPTLSAELHSTQDFIGLVVPAYMIPYGISTLFYGPISDRVGSKPILLFLLALLVFMTAGPATAQSARALIGWRVVGGITAGGIIPIGLSLLSDLFPYEKRGHAMGWVFGGIAGGTAFGSTLGAFLNPIIGWRAEFLGTAALTAVVAAVAIHNRAAFEVPKKNQRLGLRETFLGYFSLLSTARGFKGYGSIFINGMFHSGVFAWLGVFFAERYHLGDKQIGLALLGYGVPGMILGPTIGRFADKFGRRRIIPVGILIAALSAAAMIPRFSVVLPAALCMTLSLGFDMSHPLLVGIVSSLDPKRRGQIMGLNAFFLFMGFGLGTLVFQILLRGGFDLALGIFSAVQLCLALASLSFFKDEHAAVTRA